MEQFDDVEKVARLMYDAVSKEVKILKATYPHWDKLPVSLRRRLIDNQRALASAERDRTLLANEAAAWGRVP